MISSIKSGQKKVSPLIPPGAIKEEDILDGVRHCDIRGTLRKYRDNVRVGKMIRIVVAGVPYYVPIVGRKE